MGVVGPDAGGVVWLTDCGSTNTQALARADDPRVRAVVAHVQTAGRGRAGRAWHSPAGQGLYLSWLVRPAVPLERVGQIALLAGVAVAELCFERYGLTPLLKWPNDVLAGDGKLAGVLCEGGVSARGRIYAVGIGINLRTPPGGWPDGVPAVALDALVARPDGPHRIVPDLLRRLEAWHSIIAVPGESARVISRWLDFGPPPGTRLRRGALEGGFAGLTPEGYLRLELASGRVETITGEDVDILGPPPARQGDA